MEQSDTRCKALIYVSVILSLTLKTHSFVFIMLSAKQISKSYIAYCAISGEKTPTNTGVFVTKLVKLSERLPLLAVTSIKFSVYEKVYMYVFNFF